MIAMGRACRRIAAILLAALLACCLSGCESLGFKYVGYPEEEQGRQQIEADRPEAQACMEAYLWEKYGMAEGDYAINDLAPWTLASITRITLGGRGDPYYQGQWQARIDAGDGEFYARVAVSGEKSSYDTRQATEHYSLLEAFVRERLDLPEECELHIYVDDTESIIPADRNWVEKTIYFVFPRDAQKTLSGYYDGRNLFSPIERELEVDIIYPDGCTAQDYRSDAWVAQAFPTQATGDISLQVHQKAPGTLGRDWCRPSSAEADGGCADTAS